MQKEADKTTISICGSCTAEFSQTPDRRNSTGNFCKICMMDINELVHCNLIGLSEKEKAEMRKRIEDRIDQRYEQNQKHRPAPRRGVEDFFDIYKKT